MTEIPLLNSNWSDTISYPWRSDLKSNLHSRNKRTWFILESQHSGFQLKFFSNENQLHKPFLVKGKYSWTWLQWKALPVSQITHMLWEELESPPALSSCYRGNNKSFLLQLLSQSLIFYKQFKGVRKQDMVDVYQGVYESRPWLQTNSSSPSTLTDRIFLS